MGEPHHDHGKQRAGNRLIVGLLKRTARLAEDHRRAIAEVNEWFEARYGKSYSDVDCDHLIDILDYGVGSWAIDGAKGPSVALIDRLMADCGAPALDAPVRPQAR